MEIKALVLSPKHVANKVRTVFKNTGKKMRERSIFKFTKKKLIVVSSFLFLGLAVYLNATLFSEGETAEKTDFVRNSSEVSLIRNEDPVKTFFSQTVLDRQKSRDEALEVLQTVVDSDEALEDSKQSALTNMTRIANEIQTESNIESLIMSKGFEDCIAVISDGKCNVIVRSDGLMPNQISQIKEIVYEQANIHPSEIKIIEKGK